MKFVLIINLLLLPLSAMAENIKTHNDAWNYLIHSKSDMAWVAILSNSGNYVQCANMGDFIRCQFPVWNNSKPKERYTAPVNSRGKPYPDVPGSIKKTYLTGSEVKKIRKAISINGLEAVDVYNQVINPQDKLVGTSYDLVLVLEFDYKHFEKLVNSIFSIVWNIQKDEVFIYKTDS